MANSPPAIEFMANSKQRKRPGQWFAVGRIEMARINKTLWMRNQIGEAMVVKEYHLGRVLERYFNRNF